MFPVFDVNNIFQEFIFMAVLQAWHSFGLFYGDENMLRYSAMFVRIILENHPWKWTDKLEKQTTQKQDCFGKTIFPGGHGQVIDKNLKCPTDLHHIFMTACGESGSSFSPPFELFFMLPCMKHKVAYVPITLHSLKG